jgi:hypothetical protein
MKDIFTGILVFLSLNSYSQTSEYDGWKNGNNTFSVSFRNLESYFTKKRTVQEFEKTLDHFEKRWYASDTVKYENGRIKIRMAYNIMHNDEMADDIKLEFGKDQIINTISCVLVEDKLHVNKLNEFLQQLKLAGYEYDLGYTRLNRRLSKRTYFYNRSKKISVSLLCLEYDHKYSVEFSKM